MLTVGSPTNRREGSGDDAQNCYPEQFYIARLTPTRRRRWRFGTTGSRVSLELRQFPVETRDAVSRRVYVHAYVYSEGWRLRYEFNLQAGSCSPRAREIESDWTHFKTSIRSAKLLPFPRFLETGRFRPKIKVPTAELDS